MAPSPADPAASSSCAPKSELAAFYDWLSKNAKANSTFLENHQTIPGEQCPDGPQVKLEGTAAATFATTRKVTVPVDPVKDAYTTYLIAKKLKHEECKHVTKQFLAAMKANGCSGVACGVRIPKSKSPCGVSYSTASGTVSSSGGGAPCTTACGKRQRT